MELFEIHHMLERLQAKKKKTANDLKQIDFLQEKIFEHLDAELDKSDDLCSYSQKI